MSIASRLVICGLALSSLVGCIGSLRPSVKRLSPVNPSLAAIVSTKFVDLDQRKSWFEDGSPAKFDTDLEEYSGKYKFKGMRTNRFVLIESFTPKSSESELFINWGEQGAQYCATLHRIKTEDLKNNAWQGKSSTYLVPAPPRGMGQDFFLESFVTDGKWREVWNGPIRQLKGSVDNTPKFNLSRDCIPEGVDLSDRFPILRANVKGSNEMLNEDRFPIGYGEFSLPDQFGSIEQEIRIDGQLVQKVNKFKLAPFYPSAEQVVVKVKPFADGVFRPYSTQYPYQTAVIGWFGWDHDGFPIYRPLRDSMHQQGQPVEGDTFLIAGKSNEPSTTLPEGTREVTYPPKMNIRFKSTTPELNQSNWSGRNPESATFMLTGALVRSVGQAKADFSVEVVSGPNRILDRFLKQVSKPSTALAPGEFTLESVNNEMQYRFRRTFDESMEMITVQPVFYGKSGSEMNQGFSYTMDKEFIGVYSRGLAGVKGFLVYGSDKTTELLKNVPMVPSP